MGETALKLLLRTLSVIIVFRTVQLNQMVRSDELHKIQKCTLPEANHFFFIGMWLGSTC